MRWLITDKGDQDARRLADRHYSRQTPGDPRFTRNGQNLVFITADLCAVWVTFRPTPGKARRPDGLDAWECALFRNDDGPHLSSELIREAEALSHALWGPPPKDGFITLVQPAKIRSSNPGCCYLKADWVRDGHSSKGWPRFKAPARCWPAVPDPRWWRWKGARGGKLRRDLEERGVIVDSSDFEWREAA